MKLKFTVLSFLLLLILVLAGCNPANQAEPGAEAPDTNTPAEDEPVENQEEAASPQTPTDTPFAEGNENDCPAAAAGTHLLVDAARGICFLYPDNYDVTRGEDGSYTLYVRSLLNTEAPLASFHFEAANDQPLGDIVAQQLAAFSLPEADIHDVTLDGEPAIMLDNFPGQDTNRRLLAIYQDQVMDIMVARIGPDYGQVGEQAEYLYKTITDSFRFFPPVTGAALQAGPECPIAGEGTTLFTNAEDGYCLLLPDGYAVDDSLTTDGGTETVIYIGSLLDTEHPRLFITVTDAGAQTLDEITTARQSEWAEAGFEVMWSFGYMLDGIAANQFDQVPGQDLSRQVILVHNGKLYTLSFIPDDPSGEVYADMESLYELVMDSFSFTWQPANSTDSAAALEADPAQKARWYLEQDVFEQPAGWQIALCPGEAPFLCVSREGEVAGYAELQFFPLTGFEAEHPVRQAVAELPVDVFTYGPEQEAIAREALAALAEEYMVTIQGDREFNFPDDEVVDRDQEPTFLGKFPALMFGFMRTNDQDIVQEHYVNIVAFDHALIYWLGMHYDPAGVSSFTAEDTMNAFIPLFQEMAAGLPIP